MRLWKANAPNERLSGHGYPSSPYQARGQALSLSHGESFAKPSPLMIKGELKGV